MLNQLQLRRYALPPWVPRRKTAQRWCPQTEPRRLGRPTIPTPSWVNRSCWGRGLPRRAPPRFERALTEAWAEPERPFPSFGRIGATRPHAPGNRKEIRSRPSKTFLLIVANYDRGLFSVEGT